jgi:hypothetical protein
VCASPDRREASASAIPTNGFRAAPPTYLDVLNVGCAIYPQTRDHTDTLEDALRRLPGVSDLPSTVPSEDAVPDWPVAATHELRGA